MAGSPAVRIGAAGFEIGEEQGSAQLSPDTCIVVRAPIDGGHLSSRGHGRLPGCIPGASSGMPIDASCWVLVQPRSADAWRPGTYSCLRATAPPNGTRVLAALGATTRSDAWLLRDGQQRLFGELRRTPFVNVADPFEGGFLKPGPRFAVERLYRRPTTTGK